MSLEITTKNISLYAPTDPLSAIPEDIWAVFDKSAFDRATGRIVATELLVSNKNQLSDEKYLAGLKKDPRVTAHQYMLNASRGYGTKRAPLSAEFREGRYYLTDGNATAQVLMLLGWKDAAVVVL